MTRVFVHLFPFIAQVWWGTCAQHYSFISTLHKNNNEFVQQNHRKFITHSDPIERWENQLDYKECATWCALNVDCACVDVILHANYTFDCLFHNYTAVGSFTAQENSIFLSKQEKQCFNYCEEISYLDVCGPCKCVSMCLSLFSYYCDCTAVILDPLEDCTKPLVTQEGNLAALYNIRRSQGGGILKAMCQDNYDTSDDDLWLATLRNQDKIDNGNGLDFLGGFGYAYEDNYFIGIDEFKALVNRSPKSTLRIEVTTLKNGHNFWVEFDDFRLITHGKSTFGSFESKKDFSCLNVQSAFRFNGLLKRIFKRNAMVDDFWLYSSMTFLLRSQKSSTTTATNDDGFIVIKNNVLGYAPYLGNEYCVSFEYILTASTEIHHFVVMNNVWLSVVPLRNQFYYFFPHYMQTWENVFSSVQQQLNVWFQVHVSRYVIENKWFHTIHLDGHRLYKAEAKSATLYDMTSTILLAEKAYSHIVSCRMRNFYVNGIKIA